MSAAATPKPAALARSKSIADYIAELDDDALGALRELFALAGTERLGAPELHAVCSELGLGCTRADCSELIEQLDRSGSGTIDFRGFARGIQRMAVVMKAADRDETTARQQRKARPGTTAGGRASGGGDPRRSSVAAFIDNLSTAQLAEVEQLFAQVRAARLGSVSPLLLTAATQHADDKGAITMPQLRSIVQTIDAKLDDAAVDQLLAQVEPDANGEVAFDSFLRTIHLLFKAMQMRKAQRRKLRASDSDKELTAAGPLDAKDRRIAELEKRVAKLEKKCEAQKKEIAMLRSLDRHKGKRK